MRLPASPIRNAFDADADAMPRREGLRRLLLGTLAATLPTAGRAQRSALPLLGFLSGVSQAQSGSRLDAFRRGLHQTGYEEGRNLAIEFRWADGAYERLPGLAAELVRARVDVLVATGGPSAALAAKAASSTLPIAFVFGGDPVRLGVVKSLARPGGNATGVSFLTAELMPKRFELLKTLVPNARLVALLVNPDTPSAPDQIAGVERAARASGCRLHVGRAADRAGLEAALDAIARARPDALLVGTDAFLNARSAELIAFAARERLPAVYEGRNAVVAGGLLSYGPNIDDAHFQAAGYAARLLKGARPAELPVLQPTQFELVVNRATARRLNLEIPASLLLRASEVIE